MRVISSLDSVPKATAGLFLCVAFLLLAKYGLLVIFPNVGEVFEAGHPGFVPFSIAVITLALGVNAGVLVLVFRK